MAKKVKPDQLGAAIAELLNAYHEGIIPKVNLCSEKAIKDLVKKTKATAPVVSGDFRKNIASKQGERKRFGERSFIWYVKKPFYRLTHLLVHGHETVNGGRTKPNPFLEDALNEMLPEYEKAVEEAIEP